MASTTQVTLMLLFTSTYQLSSSLPELLTKILLTGNPADWTCFVLLYIHSTCCTNVLMQVTVENKNTVLKKLMQFQAKGSSSMRSKHILAEKHKRKTVTRSKEFLPAQIIRHWVQNLLTVSFTVALSRENLRITQLVKETQVEEHLGTKSSHFYRMRYPFNRQKKIKIK